MRVLVTGASGFIGRQITAQVKAAGHDVASIDLKEPDRLFEGLTFYRGDIRDRETVDRVFGAFKPTHVLHLASDTDIRIQSLDQLSTVTLGSTNIFDAASAAESVRRVVHASTQYVVEPGVIPPHDEYFQPYTVYGEAKALSERLLRSSQLREWVIVRPTIVWGPYHPTFGSQLWKYIRERKYVHPQSRLPIYRTYGYVENVAAQMLSVLEAPDSLVMRHVFYLGDDVMEYGEWVDAFATRLTGKRARRVPAVLLQALGYAGEAVMRLGVDAPYNLGRYHRMTTPSPLDLSPILELAGVPPVSFEEGVVRTIKWLEGNTGAR